MGDAESGAITILDENTQLYEQNKELIRLTNQIRTEIAKLEKRLAVQPFVFIGGVSVGVAGGYFMIDGFRNGNAQNAIIGGSVIAIDFGIYVLGRYLFKWW